MDDTLKRLLAAEQRAERLVDDALVQQAQMLENARDEARLADERFDSRMREHRKNLEEKAAAEAKRSIAELERRFVERGQQLDALADRHRDAACEAVMAMLTDPDRL